MSVGREEEETVSKTLKVLNKHLTEDADTHDVHSNCKMNYWSHEFKLMLYNTVKTLVRVHMEGDYRLEKQTSAVSRH